MTLQKLSCLTLSHVTSYILLLTLQQYENVTQFISGSTALNITRYTVNFYRCLPLFVF